jgi:hypothetical protein
MLLDHGYHGGGVEDERVTIAGGCSCQDKVRALTRSAQPAVLSSPAESRQRQAGRPRQAQRTAPRG